MAAAVLESVGSGHGANVYHILSNDEIRNALNHEVNITLWLLIEAESF